MDAYKENKIDFWGLTVENEPTKGFDPTYTFNCLGLSPENERDFVKLDLGPALKHAGYGSDVLKLMIFDESLSHIVAYADTILNDTQASKYIAGIATHWYDKDTVNPIILEEIHRKHPDFFILSSEACDGSFGDVRGPKLGDWTRAESYASDILNVCYYSIIIFISN